MFEDSYRPPLTEKQVAEKREEVRTLANSLQARFGTFLPDRAYETVCHYQNGGSAELHSNTVEAALEKLKDIERKMRPGTIRPKSGSGLRSVTYYIVHGSIVA